jgi:hypothetical protein
MKCGLVIIGGLFLAGEPVGTVAGPGGPQLRSQSTCAAAKAIPSEYSGYGS